MHHSTTLMLACLSSDARRPERANNRPLPRGTSRTRRESPAEARFTVRPGHARMTGIRSVTCHGTFVWGRRNETNNGEFHRGCDCFSGFALPDQYGHHSQIRSSAWHRRGAWPGLSWWAWPRRRQNPARPRATRLGRRSFRLINAICSDDVDSPGPALELG